MLAYKKLSCVRGYHVYKGIWRPEKGEIYSCAREPDNKYDKFAVAIKHNSLVVGHVPKNISYPVSTFLIKEGAAVFCEVTGGEQRSFDLPQGGREIPCNYIFFGSEKDLSELKSEIKDVVEVKFTHDEGDEQTGDDYSYKMHKDMCDKRTVEVVQSLDSCCDESYTGDEDELTDSNLLQIYKEMSRKKTIELEQLKAEFHSRIEQSQHVEDKDHSEEVLPEEKQIQVVHDSEILPKCIDAEVQFDYSVPMEDLLHGACIVDETVFYVHGNKKQYFDWKECGCRFFVPQGALSPTETCSVAVKALIGGRFILPEGTEIVSALYAISAERKFQKEMKIEIEHCLLLESETQTKLLHFVNAHQTEPGTPYIFHIQKGGEFRLNDSYAALCQSEFSIIGLVTEVPGSSSSEGQGSSSSEGQGSSNQSSDVPVEVCVGADNKSDRLPVKDDTNESPNVDARDKNHNEANNPLYRALAFYEWESRNRRIFIFVAVKHIAVHIKFVKNIYSNHREGPAFTFRFTKCSDPQVALCFPKRGTVIRVKHWTLQPHSFPCSVSKIGIDQLGAQESSDELYPDVPKCMVAIFADDNATSNLSYSVPIDGIIEEGKIINIIVPLESSSSEANPQERKRCQNKQPEDVPDSKRKSPDPVEERNDEWDILKKSPEPLDVHDLMKDHSSQWDTFGRALNIPENFRSIVKNDSKCSDDDAKLEKMLHYWIDYEPSDVTWKQIIKILEKLTMKGVARKVRKFLLKEDVRSKYMTIEDFTPYQNMK